ncbi:MAG: hypothetical protein GXY83_10080, partial [Rhodopirellula sp.]|nr:hypothetical protein [Rhodopirellula sp.]
VTVHGEGGNSTGNNNYGVAVSWANSRITSTDGAVLVEGIGGGTGSSAGDHGVVVSQAGTITSGTGAAVAVTGTGGNPAGSGNTGVFVHGSNSRITSGGGTIELLGDAGGAASSFGIQTGYSGQVTGTAAITLTADSMDLTSAPSVNAGLNAVILRPRTAGTLIDLGGTDLLTGSPLTLGLSDAELDSIIAGTLTIGDVTSGTMSLTAEISRAVATDVNLISGGAIQPVTAGIDITAGEISFASTLEINISGTAVDTEYWQLNIAGDVDLSGVALDLTGSPALSGGESFTIVNNGGGNPITGTFVGLTEGAVISNLLGSGRDARITYTGGNGNDVVLTVASPPATVVGRHVFYDNSYWDGNIAGPNGVDGGTDHDEDNDAIATDKQALIGDGATAASSANYTNFSGGITGIMIDVSGLANPAGVDVSDFVFRYGNDNTPDDWTVADDASLHSPSGIATRDLGGGVTRITITWDRLDGPATSHMAVPTRNWLEVTMLANPHTGLPAGSNDVFYFGNAAGDVNADAWTLYDDIYLIYTSIDFSQPSADGILEEADINRDGWVLYDDIYLCYSNIDFSGGLNMIAPPPAPVAEAESAADAVFGDETMPWVGELLWAAAMDGLNDPDDEDKAEESAVDAAFDVYAEV